MPNHDAVGEDVAGITDFSRMEATILNSDRYSEVRRDPGSGPEKSPPPHGQVLPSVLNHHPQHPHLAHINTRLQTFRDWPKAMPQRPLELAEAGFFYLGRADFVQCYHCDGGLKDWDIYDTPWEEHARWFPECTHVLLDKGSLFVQEVLRKHRQSGVQTSERSSTGEEESKAPACKKIKSDDSGYDSTGSEQENQDSEQDQNLAMENRRLREQKLCKICVEREVGVVFVPCGHFAVCAQCAPSFQTCPVCRQPIHSVIRTFIA